MLLKERYVLCLLVLIGIFTSFARAASNTQQSEQGNAIIADAEAVPTISWEAAGQYVGREVFAVGRIVRTGGSRSGHNFLNFSNNFRETLTIFIHSSNVKNFPEPPQAMYKNKMVKVRGTVYLHNNAPNIAINGPDNITILPDDTPLPPSREMPKVEAAPGGVLTLATLNVLNLFDEHDDPYHRDEGTPPKPRRELVALAAYLKTINADVVALEEIENRGYLQRFLHAFVPELGYENVVLIEGNDLRGIDVALLSRLPVGPVTSYRHLKFPDADGHTMSFHRDLLRVRIEPDGGTPFDVFVVHLKSKGGEENGSLDIRLGEARAIRGVFDQILGDDPGAPFLICGDFNDTIDSEPLQTITGSGDSCMINFISELPKGEKSVTYNQPPHLSMIDFILASPGMAERYVKGSYTILPGSPKETGSDHNAVVAKFKVKTD